jgi:hypothetical protein
MRLLVLVLPGGATKPTAVQSSAVAHDTPIRLFCSLSFGAGDWLGAGTGAQSLPFHDSTRVVVGLAGFPQE